jgi:hypothetical protein
VDVLPPVLWAHLALASFLAAETPDARDSDAGILYLVAASPTTIDAAAVVDAVGIYTRDLGLGVRIVRDDAGESAAPDAAPRVALLLRARRARLAFWCVPSADGRSVALVSVEAAGTWREDRVAYDDALKADFHRAVALKLRAILTSAADDAASAASGAPSATAAAPAVLAPVQTRPPAPPADARALAPPSESARWALAAQYGLGWASGDFAGARQSVGLELAAAPGSVAALEFYAGARVARAAHGSVSAGTVELSDVPLWLGARWVGGGRRLALGLGGWAAAHLLSATARSSTSETSNTFTASGGAGLEAQLRVPASGRWSVQLTAWAEAILPRTRLLVADSALDSGRFQGGLSLGVALSTR